MASITENELLDALTTAVRGSAPEHARTAQEMADGLNIYVGRVRRTLGKLQRAGRLAIHRVERTDLSGRPQVLPAYTILPPPKKKARG